MVDIKGPALRVLLAFTFVLLLGASLTAARPAQAAVISFDVPMSGVWENPAVSTPGYGLAHFTFDESTRILTYAETISGLSSDQITASHIHRGPVGTNGPIVYPLSLTGFTQISGQITLTDADVADLKAGNFYVNAHSVDHPGGFARGQLFLDPVRAIETTGKAAIAAYNAHDLNRLMQFFTDRGFEQSFEVTKAEAQANPDAVFGGPPGEFVSATDVTSAGTTLTATITLAFGSPSGAQVVQTERDTLVADSGVWRIDDSQQVDTPIPPGDKVVNVSLTDFAFNYDKSQISGKFDFHFVNNGTQPHEAVLVKLDTDKSLDAVGQDLFAGGPDAPPPPYLDFVNANEADVGGSFNFVFSNPLPAGRYAFFCFFEDQTTGKPHFLLGMRSEFTVGGGGTGVLPPNTGDGGLVRQGSHDVYLDIGLELLVFAALAGGALEYVRRHS